MKINVIIRLKSVIERAPECTAKLRKSFRKFFCETMILYITMFGRVNYTAMSKHSDSCESTFRQNFKRKFDPLAQKSP